MDPLFAPLFGASVVADEVSGAAWLRALCEVETALARACAAVGLVETVDALEVAAVSAELGRGDPAALGREAVAGGNPVIPLVHALRAAVTARAGEAAARAVHRGATSQDVHDTAMMLISHRALDVLLPAARLAADAAAALAREHRDLALAGRTLLQQARPTTFGAVTAGWGAGLDRAVTRCRAAQAALPVQLGGPAGTLAELHPHGPAVRAALAAELGLADPHGTWHTDRTYVAALAGALGELAVAVAKPAGDVVLLAQTELGEVREAAPGGSSSMAHKHNPIAAVTARAAVLPAPGLVATLLTAGGGHELQRAAGAWHAEWPALSALLVAVGGGAARLRDCLRDLRPQPAAMAANLARLAEHTDVSDVGHAADLVDDYLSRRTT